MIGGRLLLPLSVAAGRRLVGWLAGAVDAGHVIPMTTPSSAAPTPAGSRFTARALDAIERVGNRLPDPAALFVILLAVVWVLSALLAGVSFAEIDPRTGNPIRVLNQLAPARLADFLSRMVTIFTGFHPLGVVLVALLGVGVAEHTGFINAGLKAMLRVTSARFLTPMVVFVGIVSHTAADAGYVLVIPLGAVIFAGAGRHPLAGIAAAFAGVSGGFSANTVPSSLDPLLAGLTQAAAQIVAPGMTINPLNNWYFTAASSIVIILVGWYITDRVVEPRLRSLTVDGTDASSVSLGDITDQERRGLRVALLSVAISAIALVAVAYPAASALRSPTGQLTAATAPLMRGIVPLIFVFFLIPGVVYGYAAKTVKGHRDIIAGMSRSMSTMGYYIVMAFFASLFIAAFTESNLGALIALEGAAALKAAGLPAQVTIIGIVLLTLIVNLFIGSASAKWALLAPIFVPMLMQLGISADLTQAAYRVGDSSTNIITPLMPYFPLVVVFCQRYVKNTGIGTLVSMMLPYSVAFLAVWTAFLLAFWGAGIPLGVQASYVYP